MAAIFELYKVHLIFLVSHSTSNPTSRITSRRVAVMVFFVCSMLSNGRGSNREISISKIKNRTIMRKNCIEKMVWEVVCIRNPHSKLLHLYLSFSFMVLLITMNVIKRMGKEILKKRVKSDVILSSSSINVYVHE